MYKKGAGNDKQGKDAGNRTLCPYRNFIQAIMFLNERTHTKFVDLLLLTSLVPALIRICLRLVAWEFEVINSSRRPTLFGQLKNWPVKFASYFVQMRLEVSDLKFKLTTWLFYSSFGRCYRLVQVYSHNSFWESQMIKMGAETRHKKVIHHYCL